jgi:hypothetical protein
LCLAGRREDADAVLGQQVTQLREHKYAQALTVQRVRVANIKKAEAVSPGTTGKEIADSLAVARQVFKEGNSPEVAAEE